MQSAADYRVFICRTPENGAEYEAVATFEAYDEECMEFDPYAFIKSLPPLSECVPPSRAAPLLPCQTRRCKRKTLARAPCLRTEVCLRLGRVTPVLRSAAYVCR